MGHWLLSFVLLTLAATTAVADEWKKNYTVAGRPEIRVDTNDASIEVKASNRTDIEAHVYTEGYEIGPGKVRITERQAGNRIEIEVRRPGEHLSFGFHARTIRIEVSVPREVNLELRSGDGHIRLDDVKGEFRLDTGDGHIEANRVDGSLRAHTGDGHVSVDGRFDDLDIRTSDGGVETEIRAGSKLNSSWSVRTGDGSVNLRLPGDLAADLDASTGDGHIMVDFPVTTTSTPSRSSLRGKINGGGHILEIRTGDGSIRIGRS